MMTFKGIEQVNFGHIAAEEEVAYLQDYFIETDEYKQVSSDIHKILVIGRKGSGKSAIYVALRDYFPKREENVVVEALSLQNYPWELHKKVSDLGVPIEQSYINSWKYIIWVLLAKRILGYSKIPTFKFVDGSFWQKIFHPGARYLQRFLKINYGSLAPSFAEIIADKSREIRSIKIHEVELSTQHDESAFQKLSRSINVVNSELQSRVISLLDKGKKYFILFDQLDLGWDNSDESKHLMIGLILAARDMVRAAETNGKTLHIVLLIRSDIYETLRFEDKNKISPDIVELRWDEKRLQALVERRINASANGGWDDVFTGEPMRQQVQQVGYMVRRTMLRPRDMIQYCVFAREKTLLAKKSQVDKQSIYEAERPYADYMRKEIQDETKAQPISVDTLFSIIQELHSNRIKKEEFLTRCRSKNIDGEQAIKLLIDLSVLGVYRIGGNERGSSWIYKYQASPWENLDPSISLAVHPSLKHALSLVEARTSEQEDEID